MKSKQLIQIGLGILLLSVFVVVTGKAQAISGSLSGLPATLSKRVYLPLVMRQEPLPVGPILVSPSLYMTTLDPQTVNAEGCALGQRDLSLPGSQDSIVVLDFGYPQKYANGTFGARGFAYPPQYANTDQIAAVAENFGVGYLNCSLGDASHLRIAIGTSNWPGDAFPAVTAEHGAAWAKLVGKVNDWFISQCKGFACEGRVDVAGASDIELSWNGPDPTTAWVNGFASVTPKYPMYNYGAVEGCPWLAHTTYNCVWADKEKVWYVIWGAAPVQPIPEIYATSGVNAEQWYLMSVYSYVNHKQKIQFVGPMSELGACQQRGGCKSIDNTPQAAWTQLYNLLNGDARTAGEPLKNPTDIKYLGE